MKELSTALVKAQKIMGSAKKGSDNPFFKSKYAELSEVIETVKEPLNSNGIAYVQFAISEGDQIGVETRLIHESGQSIGEKMMMKAPSDPQKCGAIVTYFRRYQLLSICGVPTADDDAESVSSTFRKQPQNNQTPMQNPGSDDVIKFGRYNGMTYRIAVEKVGLDKLEEYAAFIKKSAKSKGETLTGNVLEFVNKIDSL